MSNPASLPDLPICAFPRCSAAPTEEVIRALALCFFDYLQQDLDAFIAHKKTDKKYANMTEKQILNSLPLSALRRHVRREYIAGALQAKRMEEWYAKYMSDATMAIDTVTGRHIVAGPFGNFETVFGNQLALARDGYLSGE